MQTRGLHAPECDMNDLVEYIHGTQTNQKEKFQLGPTPPNWRLYGIDKTHELLGNITLHICLRQIQPHNQEPKYGHYSVEFDHEGATKTIENIKGPIDRQFISLQGKFEAGKTKANITMDILNNQGHIDHTQDFEAKDLS
ncbi:unnamed protein product, partial [Mesorhabditis spiculigera]